MSSEVAVREQQAVATVRPHRTRQAILAPLGIVDDPAKPIAKVIKDHLKSLGLTPKDVNTEYLRILKEDLDAIIDLRIKQAEKDGWVKEIRVGKLNAKTGEEGRFSVSWIPPKAPKLLSLTEQSRLVEALGGKDSAKAKELLEYLAANNRLAKAPVRDMGPVETTPVETETK